MLGVSDARRTGHRIIDCNLTPSNICPTLPAPPARSASLNMLRMEVLHPPRKGSSYRITRRPVVCLDNALRAASDLDPA